METLVLTKPNKTHSEQIRSYRQEFLEAGSSMDGCGSLQRMEDPGEWLRQVDALSRAETAPPNWVQSTQFLCLRPSDGRLVGMIQVRHRLSAFLAQYGGHIGYSVRPSERRKGYATGMLRACLPHCKALGIDRLLITCLDDNEGSRRAILKNGGVYESTVVEPSEQVRLRRYWITL